MSQSRAMSLLEAVANVVVGWLVAVTTLQASLSQHLAIGSAFTAVSLLRSYFLRRLFERHDPEVVR